MSNGALCIVSFMAGSVIIARIATENIAAIGAIVVSNISIYVILSRNKITAVIITIDDIHYLHTVDDRWQHAQMKIQ